MAAPLVVFRGSLADGRLPALLLCIFLISVVQAVLNVSWLAWKQRIIPGRIRGQFLGTRNVIAGFGGMAATLLAGRWLDFREIRFAHIDPVVAYAAVFGVAAMLGLFGPVVLRRVPDGAGDPIGDGFIHGLIEPIQQRTFRRFILFGMAWGLGTGVAMPFFTVFMLQDLQLSFSTIALLGVVSGLANMGGMVFWGRLSDVTGPKPLLGTCVAVVSVLTGVWLLVTPNTIAILWPLMILTGWFWAGNALCSVSMLLGLARPGRVGPYLSVFAAATGICTAIGPVAGGWLLSMFEVSQEVLPVSSLHMLFLTAAVIRISSVPVLSGVQTPTRVPFGVLLSSVAEFRRLQPGLVPAWGAGLAALENVNTALGSGAAVMEAALHRALDRALVTGRAFSNALFLVDRQVERRVSAWEALIGLVVDSIVDRVRRLVQWLVDDEERK